MGSAAENGDVIVSSLQKASKLIGYVPPPPKSPEEILAECSGSGK
jgi:hypothetical protein